MRYWETEGAEGEEGHVYHGACAFSGTARNWFTGDYFPLGCVVPTEDTVYAWVNWDATGAYRESVHDSVAQARAWVEQTTALE